MKRLIAFALALAVVFGVSFALYKPERIEAAAQETMDDEWVGYFFALEPFDGRRYATENGDDYDFGVPGVPARAGQAIPYRAYSCRAGAYLPEQCFAPQPLVIVEGSYSCHPTLADCYDLKVFVTCSKEEQARRLLAREGERYSGFTARWIPLEEGYFAKFQIEQTVDFILDTTC